MKSLHGLHHWHRAIAVLLLLSGLAVGSSPVYAQTGSVTSSATPSNALPDVGGQIEVAITIDVTGVAAPDSALGSFTGSLDWNPAVLAYNSDSGILGGFTGIVNDAQVSSGHLIFNGAKATGATGAVNVLNVRFDVVGAGGSALDLEYSAMAAAYTFRSLLPLLTIDDGHVQVGPVQYYALTIAVDPAEGGATDPVVGVHTYPNGTVVDVTATPNPEYQFDHWAGACTGSGSCTVTMNSDKAVTAVFAELPLTCYALTLSHTGQGSDPVADPPNSTGCPAGRYVEGAAITLGGALPDPGWQIVGWSGTTHDDATADNNSLIMPASAHAAGVIYKVRVHLPLLLGGSATVALGLSQPANGGLGAVGAGALASSDTEGVHAGSFGDPTQQMAERQAPTRAPALSDEPSVMTSSRSGADTEVPNGSTATEQTRQTSWQPNFATASGLRGGRNLASVTYPRPVTGVLDAPNDSAHLLRLFFALAVVAVLYWSTKQLTRTQGRER